MNLAEEWRSGDHRVCSKWDHFFPLYERHLAPFVGKSPRVLEIGVQFGGSLQLWKRWFGPGAQVVGIDIDPDYAFEEDQITVRVGNQTDLAFLATVVAEFGAFDIIIDDGSHRQDDTERAFGFLYPRMSATGVYVVEDVCCAYWPDFRGEHRSSFVETTKSLIDELNNTLRAGRETRVRKTPFEAVTYGISFYPSMIVFERGDVTIEEHEYGS